MIDAFANTHKFLDGPVKPRSVFLWRNSPVNWKKARAAHLELGRRGETCAVKLLKRRNCVILARDWRKKGGELDIVACDGGILLFVEVKTLREKPGFAPAGNLSPEQRRRNRRAAQHYMALLPVRPVAWRFDLVEVVFRGSRVETLRRHADYLPPGGASIVAEALARRPFW